MSRGIVGLILVLGALAVSLPISTALADEQSPIESHQIHGLVSSKSSDTAFVVTTAQHGNVNVTVPAAGSTSPGRGQGRGMGGGNGRGRSEVVAQVAVGDRVVIQGQATGAAGAATPTFEARRIHVLPRGKVQHVVGTFKSFSSGSLTITVGGTDRAFTINSSTVVKPDGSSLTSITGAPTITVVTRDGTLATSVNVRR